MHLKEAYQRRNQQVHLQPFQTNSIHANKLHKDYSNTIGSIHTGTINYNPKQPFFLDHSVKQEAIEAKNSVKKLKNPDHLGLKPKEWNISNQAPPKFDLFQQEESEERKLLKIRSGFYELNVGSECKHKNYMGTESRNDYSGWNVSTHFETKQKKIGQEITNLSAFQNTLRYSKRNLSQHKNLKKRFEEGRSLEKSEIMNSSDILNNFKQSYLFNHPSASPERTNANVKKMFDSYKLNKVKMLNLSELETPESFNTSFKAKLSPSQKQKIKYTYFHTGSWQKQIQIKTELKAEHSNQSQEDYQWSCCLSSSHDNPGCSFRIEDRNKMNLSSSIHA